MIEDVKYRNKYRELKKRIRDIEEENDLLHIRLYKARKNISQLKLERTFLLDRMEKVHGASLPNSDHSDMGSDIETHDGIDLKYHSTKHGDHHRGRIDKMLAGKPPRRKKDPNAPKGPGNVFFLYCRLERDKIKDQYPQENLGEVTKLLGQKWKSLSKEEKQKYYDMYKKEMEEYEEAMKSYTGANGLPLTDAVNGTEETAEAMTLSAMSSPVPSTDDPSDSLMPSLHDIDEDEVTATPSGSIQSVGNLPSQTNHASTDHPITLPPPLSSSVDPDSAAPTPTTVTSDNVSTAPSQSSLRAMAWEPENGLR
ncbi:uncharacterized protein BYT42DRAFT_589421 [Radiomyces spectabilis]|uniref:uncharacterized protein n=1 Tax=Radiomyces spectabilis TaxID=64574 RepID=UPI00221F2A67|nr:uncharacterized protein BYT42DRAFT_589421 [Radiomyces spectabilis]KAI8365276.1 hypothetical protein BYT42DRAFT_589421 [Radiomyces spectabilis]